MCYDFRFFYTSAPYNVTSAQDCKCIFDPKFPRVSDSSVPYSIVLFTFTLRWRDAPDLIDYQ
jgi:hypothetical protein